MEVRAVAKYVKVQPRKVRQVAREVRGNSAAHMVQALRFHPSKSAFVLRKVLMSAMANAQENHNLDPDKLRVRVITVDEGPKQKRIQARAMGRANRILKKTSHITVIVEDYDGEQSVKPHGTQAKARPSLAAKAGKGKKKSAETVKDEAPVTEDAVIEPTDETVVEEPVAEAEVAEAEVAETEAVETKDVEAEAVDAEAAESADDAKTNDGEKS